MSEDTDEKQKPAHLFKPGQSGNPNGRPKGARSRLGEAFIAALHDDFESHGMETIARVREERPQDYMKVVASLLPKEFKIETVTELTDEQLDSRIRQLANLFEVGVIDTSGGGQEAQGPETAH